MMNLNLQFEPFPHIETARLRMRKISVDDAEHLYFIRSDEKVMLYLDRKKAESVSEMVEFIRTVEQSRLEGNSILWQLELKETGEQVGNISFWRIDKGNFRAELGYTTHHKFWGQGLVSEALHEALKYGFRTMNLHSVEANINPANKASEKLLLKAGFTQEAYFRENYYFDGKFLDSAIFSLLARDFKG